MYLNIATALCPVGPSNRVGPGHQRNQHKVRKAVVLLFEIEQWVCHSWTTCPIAWPGASPPHLYPSFSSPAHYLCHKENELVLFMHLSLPSLISLLLMLPMTETRDNTRPFLRHEAAVSVAASLLLSEGRGDPRLLHSCWWRKGSCLLEWQTKLG